MSEMAHPEVYTSCGRLRGSILENIDGDKFCAFKGIPFAKPPIGQLRFEDPVPAEKWSGTRDALEFGPMCAQYDLILRTFEGTDDCLYLNVYTKSIAERKRRPVMVWIHGGGFHFGSGCDTFYGPDYLMRKDIVLVTINYRLGVFGFLDLEDSIAPGNQGLKDQVMALQWVRDNIENFGGDSDNVTIFGESAGGASVHYLTLSPLARGLFHKAISQSGVATSTWASMPEKTSRENAYQLCEELGNKTKDHKEIVEFLRTIDPISLVKAASKINSRQVPTQCLYPFGPGVDNKSLNPFMPLPIDLAATEGAHVPYMLGHTDREGTLIMQSFEMTPGGAYEDKDANFIKYLHPRILKWLQEKNLTPDDLKRLYFENEKITKNNLDKLIDLLGDLHFNYSIHKILKTQIECNSAPTYMYKFTYNRGFSFTHLFPDLGVSGASHMDDFYYLFNSKYIKDNKMGLLKKNTQDYRIMEQMVELWTEFARTGQPTPTILNVIPVYWLPLIDGKALRYLNIGEVLRMENMLNIEERFSYKMDKM